MSMESKAGMTDCKAGKMVREVSEVEAEFGLCWVVGRVLSCEPVAGKESQYRGKYGVGHATYEFFRRSPLPVGTMVVGEGEFRSDRFGNVLLEVR